ncbi:LysR family transcriptional regulator [Jannaschia donghaensis]|uniref:DNA-binding transcriptional activator GcvA n=1 Tax=Jannaschia donghaensis TaxID=420998 RepID=A0A0M6YQS9_9RHOB|nr:LysR family transcriptional regulator [Jannaschia donghaensis]CTQ51356.1 DNA-binding transcriptional activator GcvA [Jannaschia donghaensis]
MKTGPDWNDIAYFSAIARAGGLARAAEALGVSPATLSRRMKAFEASMGRHLFRHGAEGYALTAEGRALADRARDMEEAARQLDQWRTRDQGPVPVRISAGTWTAADLAERLARFWTPEATWLPEFIYCDLDLDIARREVDIGVRNRRPDQPWLAGRQIGTVDYAVYGRDATIEGWIGPAETAPVTPSSRWVADHHSGQIVTRANVPHLAAALARAGIGRIVLPTFAGDRMEGLMRLSDPIAELRSAQWLVAHHDARNEPPIRAALDAIGGYLETRAGA